MAWLVGLTQNDVYGDYGLNAGQAISDQNICNLINAIAPSYFIRTGLTYVSAAGLVATFAAGSAVLGGYHASNGSSSTVTLTDAATNWVWLQLTVDSEPSPGPYATGAQLVKTVGATPSPPSGGAAVLLAKVVTSGGAVSGTPEDHRPLVARIPQAIIAWAVFDTQSGGGSPALVSAYRCGTLARTGTGTFTLALDKAIRSLDGFGGVVATARATSGGLPTAIAVAPNGTTLTVETVNTSNTLTDFSCKISCAVFGKETGYYNA